jgi:hypothetical protein
LISPAKRLLKRTPILPIQPHTFTEEGTIGIALGISGQSAHLRFWGEGGVHEIKPLDDRDGGNPDVMAEVSGETLVAYRPREQVVRRGWFRDERQRRLYNLTAGEMADLHLEDVWQNQRGPLSRWLADAIAANVRVRLLKMIVE